MIDTKALRSRILDLAIQGKLTEQLPSDGTAEELYQQIQAEKQKLVKEGKIKKEKPLPEITADDIPFEIPSNWKWCRLNNVGTFISGYTPKPDMLCDKSNIPYYKVSDMNTTGNELYLTKTDLYLIEPCKKYFPKNSIVYPKNGGAVFTNKKRILSQDSVVDLNTGGFFPMPSIFLMYSYLFFNTIDLKRFSKGSTLPTLDMENMRKSLFPLPPLAEQKRIVERVEEIFRVLDTIDEAQEKYSADATSLRSKLITAGIQGRLTQQFDTDGTAEELYQQIQAEKADILKQRQGRKDNSIIPVEDDVPYEIPDNWKWIRFGETGFFRKGPFGSSLTKSMFVPKNEDTIKVYEQQHAIKKNNTLGTYYITKEYFEESMKGFEVLSGDIIISCAGTIGETYVMPEKIERGIINQALMRVTVVPSIDKRFFLYYFNSQLKASAKAGNGSAIINIPPFEVLKNLYFPLPPLAEQKRIADVLERALGAIG